MTMPLSRRSLLASGLFGGLALAWPGLSLARVAGEQRLVFVIQRGAADGLMALGAPGDPQFGAVRGALAEDFADAPQIGGLFALHPALAETAKLHAAGEVLFAPAVASVYRERSHFDAQNVLETGGARAYAVKDGWLNRLVGLLDGGEARALALAATAPPVLRGVNPVSSYAPSGLPDAQAALMGRVAQLYAEDAQLGGLWDDALRTHGIAEDGEAAGRGAASLGTLAAAMLTAEGGARIATIETTRWDTHYGQRARSNALLKDLDALLAALREGMGPAWANTLVIVATEFGRTVAVNGTGGTDHGTGSLAWLLGGKVRGGRIVGDWPGLSSSALYQGRDLYPAQSLEALVAGAIAEHYALDPEQVGRTLFPAMNGRPVEGLVTA
ncbi:DUF1501 domain-containing protein [Pelagerythrobacter sp.]|uniref:DUF1501 domain-containing protein n=1 Tax=Pelagerythrobacter sp. TaxID=2800702 RepID=UPI0035B37C93